MSICLWAQKQPINLTRSSDRRVVVGGCWSNMAAFDSPQKRIIQVQCPLVFRYNNLFCFASPGWFRPPKVFKLVCLKDRAAPERWPQAPLSLGFKGPATLSGGEEMRACGGEITWAPCASLTGLLAGTRQGKSLYRQKDHGRRNLPLSPGHQGLKPGLLW